jgi:general nucleoside transport system permease protein
VLDLLANAVPLALVASTPLLLAVQGELFVQRAGMINLGIEGMMLIAAMGAVLAGPLGGIAGAALVALLFGLFTITLRSDQIVTGTAINLFALGATSFLYRELHARFATPRRMDDGLLIALTWIVIPVALAIVLWNSSFGLRLRACGENPEAVEASGHSVARHRWSALAIEALLVGLAGAHLALALSSGFAENMTAGRGFIALSIVIFGRWKVRGVMVGTAIFGLAAALQYALQAANHGVPFHLLLAAPYVVTLFLGVRRP